MPMDRPPRRTSYARREQNLALLGAVVTGAVLATGLLLVVLSRVTPTYSLRLRTAAVDTIAPFWAAVRAPFDWVGSGIDGIGDYVGTVPRARRLAAENAELKRALQDRDALAAENRALKRLVRVVEPASGAVVLARFAGSSAGSYARTAMIAAGTRDGVFAGQAVRSDAGLVGRTVEAGAHAARILLLTDAASRVPVTVVRTGQPAIAVGAAGRLLEIRDRLGAEVPLKPGDRLVTSGVGGLFAPQIPVATVVDARSEPPRALPAADPAGIDFVAVTRAYLPVPEVPAAPVDAVPVPREARKK